MFTCLLSDTTGRSPALGSPNTVAFSGESTKRTALATTKKQKCRQIRLALLRYSAESLDAFRDRHAMGLSQVASLPDSTLKTKMMALFKKMQVGLRSFFISSLP